MILDAKTKFRSGALSMSAPNLRSHCKDENIENIRDLVQPRLRRSHSNLPLSLPAGIQAAPGSQEMKLASSAYLAIKSPHDFVDEQLIRGRRQAQKPRKVLRKPESPMVSICVE